MVSPLIRRRRLAGELRSLREAAGLTSQDLAKKIGRNRSNLSRFETGDRAASVADVTAILDALGVNGDKWHDLVGMAHDAGERGWWSSFPVGERQAVYADLEHGAITIREYASFVVPGLLQVPAYTRWRGELGRLQDLFPPSRVDGAVDRAVEAKQMRQRMLRRPGGPQYEAILDESAICRPAAPSDVMREQLLYLADLGESDDLVTVRVLPQRANIKDFWIPRSPFTLYTFGGGDPPAAAVETETTDLIYTAGDVGPYTELYARIAAAALSSADSVALLRVEAARYE